MLGISRSLALGNYIVLKEILPCINKVVYQRLVLTEFFSGAKICGGFTKFVQQMRLSLNLCVSAYSFKNGEDILYPVCFGPSRLKEKECHLV